MSVLTEPKIDAHCHVLDPARFPYAPDVSYRPHGQETGSAAYFAQVLSAYGSTHALLVGPNSGYGYDNRCLLDAIAHGGGRFKGIAVLRDDTGSAELKDLRARGILGVAFNYALHGLPFYAGATGLMRRLADLDMFVNVQVEKDQMAQLAPVLRDAGARILVDHCGRPDVREGVQGAGFQALLGLARHGRTTVKLSGYAKFSEQDLPFDDTLPFTRALLDGFGPDHCIWASDWPFLKAPRRLDYGALLQDFARRVPDPAQRHAILWRTPARLFGFEAASAA